MCKFTSGRTFKGNKTIQGNSKHFSLIFGGYKTRLYERIKHTYDVRRLDGYKKCQNDKVTYATTNRLMWGTP